MSSAPSPLVVAVVGPTATGKSVLGLALARALDGDVVNADASQLYRGMDIGTAKLPLVEREDVPHLLLDLLAVTEEASLAEYQHHAHAAIDAMLAAARCPIVVGGSGLYLRAALDELAIPPTDARLRADLEAELAELAELGPGVLHRRLAELDPAAAVAILPSNTRRVVRALEVNLLTGGPFPATMPTPRYRRPCLQLGLRVPREVLDARIGERVDQMWRHGLVAEVAGLLAQGLRQGRTAARALGYAQVIELLDGELTDSAAREATIRATCRLARRQESWLRRDSRVVWLEAYDRRRQAPVPLSQLLAQALAAVDESGQTPGPDSESSLL